MADADMVVPPALQAEVDEILGELVEEGLVVAVAIDGETRYMVTARGMEVAAKQGQQLST